MSKNKKDLTVETAESTQTLEMIETPQSSTVSRLTPPPLTRTFRHRASENTFTFQATEIAVSIARNRSAAFGAVLEKHDINEEASDEKRPGVSGHT